MSGIRQLYYKRKALEFNDGADGFLYLHVYDDVSEELIFKSKEAADKWILRRQLEDDERDFARL